MSEQNPTSDPAIEADVTFHKAALVPSEWAVICPICGAEVPVEARQDDNGAWCGDGLDQFPECGECHAMIEVIPVSLQEVNYDGQ